MSALRATPAAFLAGASGLGTQVVLLGTLGLAVGHGRGEALGLALYVAGWGVGASLVGASRLERRAAPVLGLAAGLASALCVPLVLAGARADPGEPSALALAALAVLAAALASGALLGLVVRLGLGADRRAGLAPLWAADLAGAVFGAFLAHRLQGALGRPGAVLAFGALALLAGLAAFASARRSAPPVEPEPSLAPFSAGRAHPGTLSWGACALVVGLATGAAVVVEWVGLRLAALWVGGMQEALSVALAASLAALALGAALLPPLLPRGARGVAAGLGLAAAGIGWIALLGWSAAPDAPLAPLFSVGSASTRLAGGASAAGFALSLLLVGPALAPFGALLPLVYRAAPPLESGRRLGRLCVHEAWGAALVLPLAHGLVVPSAGLAGALAVALGALGILALVLARRAPAFAVAVLLLVGLGLAALRFAPAAALASPPLVEPALVVRAFGEDEHFAVCVVDDGLRGERTLLTDGFRAAGTGRDYRYMRALGALPVLLHPAPERVCVLALGTGTTAGAVARHPAVGRIEVLEISRTVADFAPWFLEKNEGVLEDVDPRGGERADGRVELVIDDGRRALARRPGRYDVVTLEPLLPDSPFAVYLYTPEFYALARGALRDERGLVCQWVPPHALEPATLEAVLDAFARSFRWSGAFLFGTQLVLVGGDAPPALAAARFPEARVEAEGELGVELAALGLDAPAGVLARWIGSLSREGAPSTRAARALCDADPWIVFRPRRRGAVLLGDLPTNLARLAELDGPPPAGWLEAAGLGALAALEAGRALRAARLAFALEEARARGLALEGLAPAPGAEALAFADALERGRAARPGDPEARELGRERAFLRRLRLGVARLASSPEPEAAALALEDLVAAVELAPERADVHLYAATALARLGEPAAEQALALALERCPGLVGTREGRRALDELGLCGPARETLERGPPAAGEPSVSNP